MGSGRAGRTMALAASSARPDLEWIACPACGADRPSVLATPGDLEAERALLERFHARRARPGAPPERRKDRVDFTEAYATFVVACGACGLVHRNPVLPKAAQVETYAGDDYPEANLEAAWAADRARHGETLAVLEARLGGPGRVLEVGAFAGGFLDAARHRGWRAIGTDVGEQVTDFARRKGLRVLKGEVADIGLPAGAFDAACVWNCFDHLRDPGADLAALALAVRPGGLLAVRVPNGDFYCAARRLAARGGAARRLTLALLAYNNFLAFPYLCAYPLPALVRLLGRHGFDLESVGQATLVPLADAHTAAWAAVEERALKAATRAASRLLFEATSGRASLAPWLDLVARRRGAMLASARAHPRDRRRPPRRQRR